MIELINPIINVIVICLSGAFGYAMYAIKRKDKKTNDLELRIQKLELSNASISTSLLSIQADLAWLRNHLVNIRNK